MSYIHAFTAGDCDYFFWIVPRAEYTPACNPVGRSSYVDCTALMYEAETNATRPSFEFYWSPNADMVPSTWINITASPSKYSATERYYSSSNLPRIPPELSGINGYERQLTISSTGTSDFGYYWCILEHPPGSSNIGIFEFSQSQTLHLYQPNGVTTPCPSSRYDSTYWEILAEPECCEISIPTPTPTPTTLEMTIEGGNNKKEAQCCTNPEVIIIALASVSTVILICILSVPLLCFVKCVLRALDKRDLKFARRSKYVLGL